jgi:hypothetical protein
MGRAQWREPICAGSSGGNLSKERGTRKIGDFLGERAEKWMKK